MVSGTMDMGYEIDTPIMTGGFPTHYLDEVDDDDPITEWTSNFFWIWQHTLGGKIPFIFCPNTVSMGSSHSHKHDDQFAICKFDNQSLQIRQVTTDLYNVSVSIREI